jgi:hypothetical protein
MYESLIFTPLAEPFDLSRVETFLASMPFTFRDPTDAAGPYLLCGNAGATHYSRARILEQPGSEYPSMCLVTITPDQVRIAQMCADDALLQAREVAEWLHANFRCRIADGDGRDLTSLTDQSLARLYDE